MPASQDVLPGPSLGLDNQSLVKPSSLTILYLPKKNIGQEGRRPRRPIAIRIIDGVQSFADGVDAVRLQFELSMVRRDFADGVDAVPPGTDKNLAEPAHRTDRIPRSFPCCTNHIEEGRRPRRPIAIRIIDGVQGFADGMDAVPPGTDNNFAEPGHRTDRILTSCRCCTNRIKEGRRPRRPIAIRIIDGAQRFCGRRGRRPSWNQTIISQSPRTVRTVCRHLPVVA
jgi:hypothetical protein